MHRIDSTLLDLACYLSIECVDKKKTNENKVAKLTSILAVTNFFISSLSKLNELPV